MRKKCETFVNELLNGKEMDIEQLNIFRGNTLMLINDLFNEKINGSGGNFIYIAADKAVVEVIDIETGVCFRRELPLRYEETGNGCSIIGEDISGNSSQISFLSEAAYEKIKDLTGRGPTAPLCGGHAD